nr:hypothetical protein Iba_scaffold5942CG0290 [Ipomoea batatas]
MKTWQPADESWWKQRTPGMLEKLLHANSPRPCMPHAKQYGEMAASPPRPPRFAWSTNDIELPRVPPVVPPPNLPNSPSFATPPPADDLNRSTEMEQQQPVAGVALTEKNEQRRRRKSPVSPPPSLFCATPTTAACQSNLRRHRHHQRNQRHIVAAAWRRMEGQRMGIQKPLPEKPPEAEEKTAKDRHPLPRNLVSRSSSVTAGKSRDGGSQKKHTDSSPKTSHKLAKTNRRHVDLGIIG